MLFTNEEIVLARSLREHGVPWQPAAGNYVLDEEGVVERGSPFQRGVYFVLNFDHFMAMAGGPDRFRERMLWLPVWEDCRNVLHQLEIDDEDVAGLLASVHAIESRRERVVLYELILTTLMNPIENG